MGATSSSDATLKRISTKLPLRGSNEQVLFTCSKLKRRFLMRRLLVLYSSFVLVGAAEIDRAALVAEINFARRQPQVYTGLIQQWANYFRGQLLMLPGRTAVKTWEAVRALRTTRPM
jgi:hypothetical protein